MEDLRFFSVGCKVQVLETASEYKLGGEKLVTLPVPDDIKGRILILDWQGRFSIRVLCRGKDMYFDKKDVKVVT
jgi:hypothetical protein